jgi:uncharacterized delta-60 repeat protein
MGNSIDFVLSNPSSSPVDLELLSAVNSNSQKSTKFRTVTPYTTSYPSGSVIIFRHSAGEAEYTLSQDATPIEVLVYFNTLNLGEFSLYANNSIDGTVFEVTSQYIFNELEINLSVTYFNIGTGFNDVVYTTAIQLDGKIIAGGNFSNYNGTPANSIIRLNVDGSIDTSFVYGAGFNGIVYDIKIQSDNKIIVAGDFSDYKGIACTHCIRLEANGTKDTGFITPNVNWYIREVAIQADGKIIAVGMFDTFAYRCIRFNTDGSQDLGFAFTFITTAFTLAIQTDGKIIVGGSDPRIVRLNEIDGSEDTSFVYGTGFNNNVWCMGLQSDGKILIGGIFTTYKGATANRIIRLNSNGSKDTSFVYGTGFDYYVYAIKIQSDGKILVGGRFTAYNGTPCNGVIRLNSDGTVDTNFISTGISVSTQIESFSEQSDNDIIIGGNFTTYNGNTRNSIAKISQFGNDYTL